MVATFEQIFKIEPGHVLKEVRAKHRNYDDDWRHEERNENGELIAIYESWDHAAPRTPHTTGWRKYTTDGALIEQHDDLPL
jgi:hypothetical protein